MSNLEYPKASKQPIWLRCSSTIRVIVVRQTKAATRKKMIGKTVARSVSYTHLDVYKRQSLIIAAIIVIIVVFAGIIAHCSVTG